MLDYMLRNQVTEIYTTLDRRMGYVILRVTFFVVPLVMSE